MPVDDVHVGADDVHVGADVHVGVPRCARMPSYIHIGEIGKSADKYYAAKTDEQNDAIKTNAPN